MDEPVPVFISRTHPSRNGAHSTPWSLREVRSWLERWPVLRTILGLLAFEMAYFFAYRFSMAFSQERPAPFWFPDTVVLTALLLTPPARWWMIFLAALPVRLLTSVPAGIPNWFLLVTFAIDATKNMLVAGGLRRFLGPKARFETTRDFAVYLLIAVAIVPALAALGGAAARQVLGYPFGQTWLRWFVGNVMTAMVVTPAVLYLVLEATRKRYPFDTKRSLEGSILVFGLVVTGMFGFAGGPANAELAELSRYLVVPFLFWAALRFGMLGASAAVLVLVTLSVQATFAGTGPFAGQAPDVAAFSLQKFLFLSAAPLYFMAISIERERDARRTLKASEQRLHEVADAAPIMIWMSTPDGRRTYFNQRWLTFTGRATGEETDDGWMAGIHPDDRTQVGMSRGVADVRKRFILEYRLRDHGGRHLWVRDQAVPCTTSDGTFLGYVGSCVELAERNGNGNGNGRHLDTDLVHVGRVSALGNLASSLAHELNQPLGAILRNAEAAELILRHDPLDHAEVLAILADIRRDDQRAGAVIDHMRSLLKRRDLELEELSVNRFVDRVIDLLRSEMQIRRVSTERIVQPNLPAVWGDSVHLEQVLLNLIVNAADAMDEIDVARRRIEIRARLVDAHTVGLAVRDHGPGVAEHRIGHLFEPFYTTKASGLGMGLAIAKVIIESHGGRIWVENDPAGGAVVQFTLRVVPRETT